MNFDFIFYDVILSHLLVDNLTEIVHVAAAVRGGLPFVFRYLSEVLNEYGAFADSAGGAGAYIKLNP